MKNHELLDMIGEVNEDYVLAAGNNVVRPRFRWQTLAACAACAALVLGAYPIWRAAKPRDLPLNVTIPLHAYTVVEGGTLTTQGDIKAEVGGEPVPVPNPGGGDSGETDIDGTRYSVPGQDAPSQEAAIAQYQGLLRGLGGQEGDLPREPETYPDWFAGSWIDNSCDPEARLAVAIVDGFRTPELETRIEGWCGGEILFTDASYSLEHLNGLMDPAVRALDGTGLSCGIGVDVEGNCLTVDLYSLSGETVPDQVLATLAALDPAGDAIRVRVFVGTLSLADDAVKCPPDVPAADPIPGGARVEPSIEAEAEPTPAEGSEQAMPATVRDEISDLPEEKFDALKEADAQTQAKYDVIYGGAEVYGEAE